jgi:hypothetical protein
LPHPDQFSMDGSLLKAWNSDLVIDGGGADSANIFQNVSNYNLGSMTMVESHD